MIASLEVQAQNGASAAAAQQHLQDLESLRMEAAKASWPVSLSQFAEMLGVSA